MNIRMENDLGKNGVLRMLVLGATLCLVATLSACSMQRTAAPQMEDSAISAGVRDGIGAEPGLAGYTITVATTDGVVHLSGNVNTGTERDQVERIAVKSEGVVKVDNYIQFGNVTTTTR